MDGQNNPIVTMIDKIRKELTPAALFEQLAEECAELSKCALKQARIMRGENPTDIDFVDVVKDTDEEVTDLLVCLEVLGLRNNEALFSAKLQRWAGRIDAYRQMQDRPESVPEQLSSEPDVNPPESVEVTPAEVIG